MAKMKEKSFFLWSRKVFGLATYLGKKSLFCHVHFLFLFIYKKKWMGLFLCHSSVHIMNHTFVSFNLAQKFLLLKRKFVYVYKKEYLEMLFFFLL